MSVRDKVIIALDYARADDACALVRQLGELAGFYKVGMQLYNAEGPAIISRLKEMGVKIFLDLKFHDIPNTVAGAAEVAVRQGVDMFNIHLSGGQNMVQSTVERVEKTVAEISGPRPRIIGVTVLTSLNETMLKEELGVERGLEEQVLALARMGEATGLDGVVASPVELPVLRRSVRDNFLIVTPGIRPQWAQANEQKRIMTPAEALKQGADYMVIGRPVTAQVSPRDSLQRIIREMEEQQPDNSK